METLKEIYKNNFEPHQFIRNFYENTEKDEIKFVAEMLYKVFNSELIKPGSTLLEIGSGPIVHNLSAPSRHIKHLVSSDFLEANRNEVQKWKDSQTDAYDWSNIFKFYAELENIRDHKIIESRVRAALKNIIPCDVHLNNPIEPHCEKYDVVLTCFCMEVASWDTQSFKSSLRNVANLIKPGGFYIEIGNVGSSYYAIGDRKFPTINNTPESIRLAIQEAGLTLVQWNMEDRDYLKYPTDSSSYFCLVATKN